MYECHINHKAKPTVDSQKRIKACYYKESAKHKERLQEQKQGSKNSQRETQLTKC